MRENAVREFQVTLDAGAFIAFEKGNGSAVYLLRSLLKERATLWTSAAVLAQVWRRPEKQGALGYLVKHVRAVDLTQQVAKVLGQMLAVTRTNDVIDAHVVQIARSRGSAVITSDPEDLLALDPELHVEVI